MWQSAKHEVRAVRGMPPPSRPNDERRVSASKRRVHVRHRHAFVGTGRGCYHFEVGVGGKEAQQLSPV